MDKHTAVPEALVSTYYGLYSRPYVGAANTKLSEDSVPTLRGLTAEQGRGHVKRGLSAEQGGGRVKRGLSGLTSE